MINALEFIAQLDKDDQLKEMNARMAHDLFKETVGDDNAGSYEYFRTKFNNKCKEVGIKGLTKPENVGYVVDYPAPTEADQRIADAICEELATRSTKNYMEGDEIPDVPGLMPTGTIFDEFISDRLTSKEVMQAYFDKTGEPFPEDEVEIGGFTRQCVDIVAGDPGAGKTYSRNILGVKAKMFAKLEQDKDLIIHFISGEMRSSEWAKELNSCEMLKHVQVTYMLDYVGQSNYDEIFWDAFSYGDYVVCDSLPAIIAHMKMSWPVSKGKMPTETQFIFDFIRKSLKSVEVNDNNVQLINQATKSGDYKGGTELPHMMSSMSFVKISSADQNRYMIFLKNRNNGMVKRQLFFHKIANGDLEFNVEAYEATYKKVNDKKKTMDEFMSTLGQDEQDKLNSMGESSATEASPAEMGTGEETRQELEELEDAFIPKHLREDAPAAIRTDEVGQTDLEDNIATEEFEARDRALRAIEAEGGDQNTYVYISSNSGQGESPEVVLARQIVAGEAEGDLETAQRTLSDRKTK